MKTHTGHRFRTGEPCVARGWYFFDGYADGTTVPLPPLSEMEVLVNAGEAFPSVSGPNKPCFWKLVDTPVEPVH